MRKRNRKAKTAAQKLEHAVRVKLQRRLGTLRTLISQDDSTLKEIEDELRALAGSVEAARSRLKLPVSPQLFKDKPSSDKQHEQSRPIKVKPSKVDFYTIECDGGTSCNVPSRGYGFGYGSFLIRGCGIDESIHRVDHGKGHSCNSAEVLTACSALEYLAAHIESKGGDPLKACVLIRCDSQITVKWAGNNRRAAPSAGSSQMFQDALVKLLNLRDKFFEVSSEWRGREVSVKLFGH